MSILIDDNTSDGDSGEGDEFRLFGRFVLAAVSPAVVVPCLLSLSERGYGLNKGIPTLVIAAASIDDVLAISAFSICMGIAFSGQPPLHNMIAVGEDNSSLSPVSAAVHSVAITV